MKEVFEAQVRAVARVLTLWPDQHIDALLSDCLRTLRGGHSLVASALGKSVPVCEKFIGTLNSVGMQAHFLHTSSAIHGDLGKVRPHDLVLVLSKSGATDETLFLLESLKSRGVVTWLISCENQSPAARVATHALTLVCEHEGDPWNLVPHHSTLIFLHFLQALAMTLIQSQKIERDEFKANHPGGAIGRILKDK